MTNTDPAVRALMGPEPAGQTRARAARRRASGRVVIQPTVYNTISTRRALDHIAATTGSEPRGADIERLSPLGSDHATHRPLPGLPARVTTRPRRLPGPSTPQKKRRRRLNRVLRTKLLGTP